MEPSTIAAALKILDRAFKIGLEAYKERQAWWRNDEGLNTEDITAIATVFGSSSDLVGMLPSGGHKASVHLYARHAAIATSAFAAALDHHWAGNKEMAPGLAKTGRLRQFFSSESQKEREKDVQSRLQRALNRVGNTDRAGVGKTLELVSALVDDPIASPWFQALWEAFTNPDLESDPPPQLLELHDPGARLEFEHAYRLEYAAALSSHVGVELGRAALELQSTQPARLRDLLLRSISTWDREHVFGAIETPGMPNMPLEDIYVEPDGIHEESKRRAPLQTLIHELLTTHDIVVVRGDFGHGKSLTARRMACAWAKTYLFEQTASSVDLIVPIFVKCADDFGHHKPSLEYVVARALRNQAKKLGLDVALGDPMFALPPMTQKVAYVVDGLDEVALTSIEVEEFFRNLEDRTGPRHKAIVFSRRGVIPEREKLRGIPIVDVTPFRVEGEGSGGQVAEWLEKWNCLSGQSPINIEQLREKNLLDIVTTPIVLFMAAMTWDAQDKAGEPLAQAEIYERFFRQIATGKCQQDHDRHMPVCEASGKLLEKLVEQGEIEKAKKPLDESMARAEAMLWLMSRVAWEGQRRAQKDDDLTLADVTNILRDEVKIRKDPQTEEMIKVGVLLVLQADRQGGNDRILFGHKSFREFLVARYWAGQLRRIVRARHSDRAALEKNLLGARLNEGRETFDFLIQMLNGSSWDKDREELIEWAQDCFNDERPDPEAESWLEDRRPVLRHAALAIGSSVKGAEGIKVKKTTTLRSMLAWFWLAGISPTVIAPRLSAEGAHLEFANLWFPNLEGANLKSADLALANLDGANLRSANLEHANLFCTNLHDANLERAHVKDGDLQGADLKGAKLKAAVLCGANLGGANLGGVDLGGANLGGANLIGANLNGANLQTALLIGADLGGANLKGANLKGVNLTDARLEVETLDDVRFDENTQWPDGVIIRDGKVIVPKLDTDKSEPIEKE